MTNIYIEFERLINFGLKNKLFEDEACTKEIFDTKG